MRVSWCAYYFIIVLVSWNATEYNILLIYIWIEPQWVVGHKARNCKFIDNICALTHTRVLCVFLSLVNLKCWFNDVKWYNDNSNNEISSDLYGIQVAALEKSLTYGTIQLANQLSHGTYRDTHKHAE